jgi:hypothetical protein
MDELVNQTIFISELNEKASLRGTYEDHQHVKSLVGTSSSPGHLRSLEDYIM